MKKITFVLAFVFLLFSCKESKEDLLNSTIKKHIDKVAKDPSSYQPIETKENNKLSVKDMADFIISDCNLKLKESQIGLREQELRLERYKKLYNDNKLNATTEEIIKSYSEMIDICNKDINKYKSKLNDTTTVYKGYIHKCRLKNGFGALDIAQYYIFLDKNDSIIAFDSDSSNALKLSVKDFENKNK